MKKVVLLLATILLSITSVHAQWWGSEKVKGNGEMITKKRSVGSYDEVKLVGSMNVILVSGKEGNLIVEAESNLQEYIETEVSGSSLKITSKKGYDLRPTEEIRITVPVESISEISLTGSGDIWTKELIKASKMDINLTGSGDMKLELDVQHLDGSLTGSGDIKLRGKAEVFECNVIGSGDFEAYELVAQNVEAKVMGSGDIMVAPKKSLEARVSGSGDIKYRGNPEKQDFKAFGSGKISSN